MNAENLIKLHLELECIGLNRESMLVRIPGPNPDVIPRIYVARHENGYELYYRHDVPREIQKQLDVLSIARIFEEHQTVKRILSRSSPCEEMWQGCSYVFPSTLGPDDYMDVVALGEAHRPLIDRFDPKIRPPHYPVYAVIVSGQIVSACTSSRENDSTAEAWVTTLTAYRRRGYARQTTAAWAHNLQRLGKIPFYSHKIGNHPSEALARKLGLIKYVDDVAYA